VIAAPPNLAWTVQVAVPFDSGFSKNQQHRSLRNGQRFETKGAKARKREIVGALALKLPRHRIEPAKLWLGILVEKTEHRTDALNVLDLVADAVQVATGLNDRWYSCGGIDWARVTRDPMLRIAIGQEARPERVACPGCDARLPLDAFPPYAAGPYGRGWLCRACGRAKK
jgi:hypothetical protein